MNNSVKVKIFTWLYRTFCYFVPGGVALWLFLIESLIDKEISILAKIGMGGIFIIVIMFVIAIYFYGKHFKTSINKVTNEILECLDNNKKTELIAKKRKLEAKQEMFRNICFVAPFVIMWVLCTLIENKIISLRGTLMTICLSMAVGVGLNGVAQWLKTKQ